MCANAGRGEGPVAAPILTRLEQEVRVCRADLTKANPFTSESSWRWASGIASRWSNDWARLVHRITGAWNVATRAGSTMTTARRNAFPPLSPDNPRQPVTA
jgi:hypothetical protein